eukprot:3971461-Prymnesium_polylepis.1
MRDQSWIAPRTQRCPGDRPWKWRADPGGLIQPAYALPWPSTHRRVRVCRLSLMFQRECVSYVHMPRACFTLRC